MAFWADTPSQPLEPSLTYQALSWIADLSQQPDKTPFLIFIVCVGIFVWVAFRMVRAIFRYWFAPTPDKSSSRARALASAATDTSVRIAAGTSKGAARIPPIIYAALIIAVGMVVAVIFYGQYLHDQACISNPRTLLLSRCKS
ncbi:hypothetical protein LMIY3S_04517 [Labrys miyagiensis]